VILRRKRGIVTASELATATEVGIRTVYRDIEALRMQGVTIDGEAGTGYRIQAGWVLPPLMFTEDELEALLRRSIWAACAKPSARGADCGSTTGMRKAPRPSVWSGLLPSPSSIPPAFSPPGANCEATSAISAWIGSRVGPTREGDSPDRERHSSPAGRNRSRSANHEPY
jgi:biotin operon repressor